MYLSQRQRNSFQPEAMQEEDHSQKNASKTNLGHDEQCDCFGQGPSSHPLPNPNPSPPKPNVNGKGKERAMPYNGTAGSWAGLREEMSDESDYGEGDTDESTEGNYWGDTGYAELNYDLDDDEWSS